MRLPLPSNSILLVATRRKGRILSIDPRQYPVRYIAVSWIALIVTVLFSLHLYVGRGPGDRDAYIIGAAGMVVFLFLSMLVRKAG